MALYYGHAEAIESYITAILNSTLNDETKEELLAEKPRLFKALLYGYADAVEKYVTAISNSSIEGNHDFIMEAVMQNGDAMVILWALILLACILMVTVVNGVIHRFTA